MRGGWCGPAPQERWRDGAVVAHTGKLFLYMKTVERAHTPKNLWEKVRVRCALLCASCFVVPVPCHQA